MKKLSFLMLAALAIFMVSCGGEDPTPTPTPENQKLNFEIKVNYQGTERTIQNGDNFVISEPATSDNPDQFGFHGKFIAKTQFKLIVDFKRQCTEGTKDELCIGKCQQGQSPQHDDNYEIIGYVDIPQLTYEIRDTQLDAEFHCTPAKSGDNIITYTFYDNQDKENKLTFTINYKKP